MLRKLHRILACALSLIKTINFSLHQTRLSALVVHRTLSLQIGFNQQSCACCSKTCKYKSALVRLHIFASHPHYVYSCTLNTILACALWADNQLDALLLLWTRGSSVLDFQKEFQILFCQTTGQFPLCLLLNRKCLWLLFYTFSFSLLCMVGF